MRENIVAEQTRHKRSSKLLGGILLISGTSIGGGMLGLPIATAQAGFIHSTLLFFVCWLLMSFTALLTLEVNLCFPKQSNIISMAKTTLGKPGEVLCWTVYLLFLYSLVSAYIAGGQDVLHGMLTEMHIQIPLWICGLAFVLLFGGIVISGIKQVDFLNRFLMIIKFGTVFLLMYFISSEIKSVQYSPGEFNYLLPAVSVAITSFGFSIIIPSLRDYFEDNIGQLRRAIWIGSFLPLLCYIAWNGVIFGAIPLDGEQGLASLSMAEQPVSGLLAALHHYLPQQKIAILSKVFTSICILTAFACVSLGLLDYLADGFKLNKAGKGKWGLIIATFLPPFLLVSFYPKAFVLFLSFAGVCCVLLQSLMPAMMAWQCRYISKLTPAYQVGGGKPLLMLSIVASLAIILLTVYQLF